MLKIGVPIACCVVLNVLAVADSKASLIITGNGDVIEPEESLIAIGSGGLFAQAAARALMQNTDLSAADCP